jgi:tetraprenyl-beta-curcumene synthase
MAMAHALGAYEATVMPPVRRELVGWRIAATTIPDPVLRRHALAAIDGKGLNAEATAVFATLAPRRTRGVAIRAMVALQVAIDYLDTLTEQPSSKPLENGLQLHRALEVVFTPDAEREDWYRLHPQRRDGGYLDGLLTRSQASIAALPAQAAVSALGRRAVARCGEGQSYTHAAELGEGGLEAWAAAQSAPAAYRWWEVAAGASSSVAAHALIAAAADPRTVAAEAALIDGAYFPSIGALTVLLDDLIDRDEDAHDGAHNYISYYADSAEAANRLDLIASRSGAALAKLRHPHSHAAILAGVAGFYLSDELAATPYAAPIRDRLLRSAGPAVRPVVTLMQLRRRRRKRPESAGSASGP